MRIWYQAIVSLSLLLLSFSGCSLIVPKGPAAEPVKTELPQTSTSGIFVDTDATGPEDNSPYISRFRFVKLDLSTLVSAGGEAIKLEPQQEISLNLFPDVTYTGVIDQVQEDAGTISWTGTLKDVEYSEMTLVFTSGVFIAHLASPVGVYEVSSVGDDLYRIIQIDQNQLPGGEG